MLFKLFFAEGPGWRRITRHFAGILSVSCLATGCATVGPLPQADLAQPGWEVHQGQAVWHLPKGQREIAGEVIVAARKDGNAFVQFSKSPFPLMIARATPGRWEVEFPPQNKRYAGRGAPPRRLLWLYLPRMLAGNPPPPNWTWHEDSNGWRLANRDSGEFIEGFFTQ